jgi:Tol biopolymer transport system component
MENQVRELLRDISNDLPRQRQVPPTLRGRARRRILAVGATTFAVTLVLVVGGAAVVRSLSEPTLPVRPPTPAPSVSANTTPTPSAGPTVVPTPPGAGEVLIGGGSTLVAHDPDTGALQTIVAASALPRRAEAITNAEWSPDHRWVAFRAGGLWLADTSGGAPRQLTADQGWNPWVWSPTGDQLAFVEGRHVTLVDAATGHATDLGTTVGAEDSEGYAVHSLVWSPDGTRIAYDGGRGGGSVYSIDVDTGEDSLLVAQPDGTGEIYDIDWSPDGAHLAIKYFDKAYLDSHKGELGPIAYKATALYITDADGTNPRLVAHIVTSQWSVWIPGLSVGTAWSPDGSRLAYANFAGPDHHVLEIWTVSADGSAPSVVTSQCCVSDGGTPLWSPDGAQIAYEAEHGGGTPKVRVDHLAVNADGTGDPKAIDQLTYASWGQGWYFCFCYG